MAAKGYPGFVVELNTQNIPTVESHVAYLTLAQSTSTVVDLRKSMRESVRNVILLMNSSDKNNLVNINTMVIIFQTLYFGI